MPKPAALRQRRNKATTNANLPSVEDAAENIVPVLPGRDGGWRPEVLAWWDSIWRSPMASEWLESDKEGGLFLIADLYQARWLARDEPKELRELSKEIRTHSAEFGLTTMSRRRLQWEVERGESAADRTAGRRMAKQPKSGGKDPRGALKAV